MVNGFLPSPISFEGDRDTRGEVDKQSPRIFAIKKIKKGIGDLNPRSQVIY